MPPLQTPRPWLRIRAVPGIGDTILVRLLARFGSPDAILGATRDQLMEAGVSPTLAEAIQQPPDPATVQAMDEELERLARTSFRLISLVDDDYPSRLKTIHDPPVLLYVSGHIDAAEKWTIAMVGSRRPSHAGRISVRSSAGIWQRQGLRWSVD